MEFEQSRSCEKNPHMWYSFLSHHDNIPVKYIVSSKTIDTLLEWNHCSVIINPTEIRITFSDSRRDYDTIVSCKLPIYLYRAQNSIITNSKLFKEFFSCVWFLDKDMFQDFLVFSKLEHDYIEYRLRQ